MQWHSGHGTSHNSKLFSEKRMNVGITPGVWSSSATCRQVLNSVANLLTTWQTCPAADDESWSHGLYWKGQLIFLQVIRRMHTGPYCHKAWFHTAVRGRMAKMAQQTSFIKSQKSSTAVTTWLSETTAKPYAENPLGSSKWYLFLSAFFWQFYRFAWAGWQFRCYLSFLETMATPQDTIYLEDQKTKGLIALFPPHLVVLPLCTVSFAISLYKLHLVLYFHCTNECTKLCNGTKHLKQENDADDIVSYLLPPQKHPFRWRKVLWFSGLKLDEIGRTWRCLWLFRAFTGEHTRSRISPFSFPLVLVATKDAFYSGWKGRQKLGTNGKRMHKSVYLFWICWVSGETNCSIADRLWRNVFNVDAFFLTMHLSKGQVQHCIHCIWWP